MIARGLKGDKVIWAVVVLLSVFSLLAVYSSTGTLAYKTQGGNTEYYMMKHLIILLVGLGLMYLAHKIKYVYYSPLFAAALWISIPLLAITLVFGLDLNDAKRVLPLPFNLTFQTSDLAKLTLIIYLARLLTKKQDQIKDFRTAFVPLILPVLAVVFLIMPANLSTALMLFTTSLVLLFIGGVDFKYIAALVLSGIVVFTIFTLIVMQLPADQQGRLETWKNRIENHVKGEGDNYQIEQARIAVATGGLFGKGPGNSTQRNFLPHPYSDFIYAIIIEEYGFVGGVFVLLLYIILLHRAVVIVTKIPQTFGAFLTIGVAFSLVLQAMINMAVNVEVVPVTGQPLPLVSMGGTSIWFTSLSIGIILSVSKEVEKKEKEKLQLETKEVSSDEQAPEAHTD
ncbi:MAG TPA: FtsW/RodA/SpoVE family cell cycle protein [Bacteroidales bacterium]|nr:FtsW/RodA/SpoVE family cell cycle protein [Bacteroidales bacterium]